jgi:hypothetical protein
MSEPIPQVYEPLNVYKSIGNGIGIVDGPLEYMTIAGILIPLGFSTRMTVIRLESGELFLHSPIAYNEKFANELREMGPIVHLVSPNQFHYAHIGEWSRAFPEAITWASPGVRKRARARRADIDFKRDLDAIPPVEWRSDIDQLRIPGGYFGEIAFFHKKSKTLILADTIINLELEKVKQPWRFATWLAGMYYPNAQIFFGMRLPIALQRKKTRDVVQKILEWNPERIVLSHGRWIESRGTHIIRRLFDRAA